MAPIDLTTLAPVLAHHGVRLAVMFGSRTRDTATAASDLDLAILAPDNVDLAALATELTLACGVEVDLVDLRDPPLPLLMQIVADGRPVYEAAAGAFASWRGRMWTQLETDRPWLERIQTAWLERVAARGLSW